MAKSENVRVKTALGERQLRRRPWIGTALLMFAILTFAALLDYDPYANPFTNSDVQLGQSSEGTHAVGVFGQYIGHYLFILFGMVAWLTPVILLRLVYLSFSFRRKHFSASLVFYGISAVVALCGIAIMLEPSLLGEKSQQPTKSIDPSGTTDEKQELWQKYRDGAGGKTGYFLYEGMMKRAVGPFGSGLIYAIVGVLMMTMYFVSQPQKLLVGWPGKSLETLRQRLASWRESRESKRAEKQALKEQRAQEKEAKGESASGETAEDERAASNSKTSQKKKPSRSSDSPKKQKKDKESKQESLGSIDLNDPDAAVPPADAPADAASSPGEKQSAQAKQGNDSDKKTTSSQEQDQVKELNVIAGEPVEKAEGAVPERKGEYLFPGLDCLQDPPPQSGSQENYQETAGNLVRTLGQFKVDVELGEIHSGPVITRYEVVPAPGIRVNKIESLDKDLALGLKAQSVRILAPVPGKGTVGIEVPNQISAPVCLREIIESKAWVHADAEIPIVLGKEVTGKPVVVDLTKMPHMLIAGSTGSGKTVCINAVIASLLYKMSPEDLRFIMVDPKVVEMQGYNELPHMLVPVVTEPKKVPGALKYLIKEMEKRFNIFAEVGVRNIAGFNAKILKSKDAREKAEQMEAELSPEERAALNALEHTREKGVNVPDTKLPYIVCVIDELADLMMVAPADIEQCIARLAQLARAAGIHLILATQRPSVNVITGTIKANLPTRIAFKVASNTDSRTILDTKGAEALIGKGDMLFTPPGSMSLVRAQGAFVSDEEIGGIVQYVHEKNGAPEFDETVQQQIESEAGDDQGDSGGGDANSYDDPLVPQAIDIIQTSKRASTSMLQRKMKIGYNRAARIMDLLEEEGIVGPDNGSSPREILQDNDAF